MSLSVIVFIVIALFVFLVVTGHYISSCLMAIGVVGIWLVRDFSAVRAFVISVPWASIASYSLSTIPMYILMAQFIMKAGIIRDLYEIVYILSRGKKAPLGILTEVLGALLGAVSGSGVATSSALGQITYPELRKRNYTPELASGICASAGALSATIPPSTIMLIYGITAEASISKMFEGAFIPGIICTASFIAVTIFYLNKEKDYVSPDADTSYNAEHFSILSFLPSLIGGVLIFVSVFGGIFSGLFTPTEAGAVGCAIAFIVALISRKMTFEYFLHALRDAAATTSMCMLLVMAASVFARFISFSLIPRYLIELMQPLIARPVILLVIITLFYFVLFMLMDGTSPVLMTVPFLLPVIEAAGYDKIWFGIYLAVCVTVGMMTPPVGMVTYATAAVTKVASKDLFKVTTVYAIVGLVITGGLIIVFPQIVTWLPSLLG